MKRIREIRDLFYPIGILSKIEKECQGFLSIYFLLSCFQILVNIHFSLDEFDPRNICRKICLDGNGITLGAIFINKADDFGVIHGLIRERKNVNVLKSNSVWKYCMNYGFVYKNILQGKL